PNGDDGVFILNLASNNLVSGNLVSGNADDGIEIQDAGTTGNKVQGNKIGTDVTGKFALGNVGEGVVFDLSAAGNTAGGFTTSAATVIAFNGGDGIEGEKTPNTILGNRIFSNGLLGIDQGDDDVPTANDAGDLDGVQNTPVLTSAVASWVQTTVKGSL